MKIANVALFASLILVATSASTAELAAGFDAALAADARSQAEKDRDPYRKPREVLEFLGIGEGMTVLEMAAGGGWYTEVLSAAVGDDGKVIAQNGLRFRDSNEAPMIEKAERLGNVELLYADLDDVQIAEPTDAAFTALNLHDYANGGPEAAQRFLGKAFESLKPGGVFGVIDHEGSAGQDNASLHRVELSVAQSALEQAGFEIEAVSDLLDNPDDDHTLHMRDESLRFHTDRFLIRARKPD